MIYAIHAVGTKLVKFGKAKDVARRLTNHQVSCPYELRVLASCDWPDEMEAKIHRLLEAEWVRGEWFKLEKLPINLIAMMKEKDGLEQFNSLWAEPSHKLATGRLGRFVRMTKEDLGVWITSSPLSAESRPVQS